MARGFEGRTALITGSAQGLGRELALMLAAAGANVVVNAATSRDRLEATLKDIREAGGSAVGALCDVSKPDAVKTMAQTVFEAFGRVDILVNNAGVRPLGGILDLSLDEWHRVMRVKLDGAFLCTKAFLPGMIEGGFGRIICVAGIDAFLGNRDRIHVGTANAGLEGFARGIAARFATDGVTANVIVPGAFDTERTHPEWYPNLDLSVLASRIPVGRLGRPSELAATCRFLASEDAAFITGQTVHVNGGAFPTR